MTWYWWLLAMLGAYALLAGLVVLCTPNPTDDDDNDPTLLGKDRFLP